MKNEEGTPEVTVGWERAFLREELLRMYRMFGELQTSITMLSQRLHLLDQEEMRPGFREPTPKEEAEMEENRQALLDSARVKTADVSLEDLFPKRNIERVPVRRVHHMLPSPGATARAAGAGEIDDHDHEFPGGGWHARGRDPSLCVHCGRSFKELQQRYGGPEVIGKPKTDPAALVKKQLGIKERPAPEAPTEPAPAKSAKGWDNVMAKSGIGDEGDEELCLEALQDAEKCAPHSPFVQSMREVFDKQQSFSKGQLRALRNIADRKRGW